MIPSSENTSLGKHLGAGRLCISCSAVQMLHYCTAFLLIPTTIKIGSVVLPPTNGCLHLTG